MKALASLLVLLLVPACQVIDRLAPASDASAAPSAGTAGRSNAEELVGYLARLRGMNEGGLAAESTRQKQLATRAPDDVARLKAALALTLAQGEESEILALVDPVARKENAPADMRAMASFLQVLANERRRLKESATAARTSLRDERRALEAQKQRADALHERAAQLQQKLDALTELEKSLSDRPPPSR
jgi:septal ring factor EnvC (AmiA/AmiB activator)